MEREKYDIIVLLASVIVAAFCEKTVSAPYTFDTRIKNGNGYEANTNWWWILLVGFQYKSRIQAKA